MKQSTGKKKTTQRTNKTKHLFFEKICKNQQAFWQVDKEKERKKMKITKIRRKRGAITTNLTEKDYKRMLRTALHQAQLAQTYKMEKFLEIIKTDSRSRKSKQTSNE